METCRKVTTRSQVSVYRTNDTMVAKNSLCPVIVLVDSQVSDRCPWATCLPAHPASFNHNLVLGMQCFNFGGSQDAMFFFCFFFFADLQ